MNVPVRGPSWVVRFRIESIQYGGETYLEVYLRSPDTLDLAEVSLPGTDLHGDSYCIGLGHVEPFTTVEAAVAAALRLGGTVHHVKHGAIDGGVIYRAR